MGKWLTIALAVTLSIEPTVYHVTFPASDQNYSVVVIITSDTNSRPYVQFDEVPIDGDQTSANVLRHPLPHGGYHITAQLMQWTEAGLIAVDSADAIILVE